MDANHAVFVRIALGEVVQIGAIALQLRHVVQFCRGIHTVGQE
jgi:hypothetical protein